jgi:hypothetical protein
VPALKGTTDVATLTIADDQGRPFRLVNYLGSLTSQWTIDAEGSEFRTLPPGSWTARATASDGTTWQGTVTVSPERTATLDLK